PQALRGRPARPLRRTARDDRPLSRADALQRAGPQLARRLTLLALLVLAGCGGSDGPQRGEVEVVATGLEVPWEIAFLPDDSALVTERPGRVRLLGADGKLRKDPVATVDVSAQGEGGLLGLALDPQFADNDYVYLYFTTGDGMNLERWRYAKGRLERDRALIYGI